MFRKRFHQPPPGLAITSESGNGHGQVGIQQYRRAVIERMRERSRRMNPLQPILWQRKRRKKWRSRRKGMNCRSEIVHESWNGQLKRSRRAARLRFRFEYVHLQSSLSKDNGCGESIGPRTDHTGSPTHREFIPAAPAPSATRPR